jgi:hypothetical protein
VKLLHPKKLSKKDKDDFVLLTRYDSGSSGAKQQYLYC